MSGHFRMSEGDWVCDNTDCQNVNFARRTKCNKCGKDKPFTSAGGAFVRRAHEVGERFAEKSHGLFSADDWQCSKCGNVNWARRSTCNVCNAPKIGPEEIRTGYGGGFKENDNISYKEKEDSDGEYDEFGRKKKHLRGVMPVVKTAQKNMKQGSPLINANSTLRNQENKIRSFKLKKSVIDSPNKQKEDIEKQSKKRGNNEDDDDDNNDGGEDDDDDDDNDDDDDDGGVDVSAYDLSESDGEENDKSESRKPLKRPAESFKDESKKLRKHSEDDE